MDSGGKGNDRSRKQFAGEKRKTQQQAYTQKKRNKQPSALQQHVAEHAKVPAHATLEKARSIDVVGFVEARSFEINALQRSLESARDSGNARAFQTLPRHLRRRAASHNVKRVPARLREKAIAEMKKSAQTSKTLSEAGQLTNAKRVNRYKRRRTKSVRMEYELRQMEKRWLETHVWHAKRMHMKERWGTMIADSPTERSHRAAYRAAMEKTYIQDVSYFRTLEFTGTEQDIIQLFSRLTASSDTAISAKSYLDGSRITPLTLYCADKFPLGLLGPASAIWKPSAPNSSTHRTLWLRLHPAHANAVKEQLIAHGEKVNVADITCELVSFELLGGQSTQLLATVLSHATHSNACGSGVLQLIKSLPSPACLSEGSVIALRIHDPRLRFPYKLESDDSTIALGQQDKQKLDNLLLNWPAEAASLSGEEDNGIWDRAGCAKDAERRPSESMLNERRQQRLIPGSKLEPIPGVDATVPLLLIRSGPEMLLGSRVASTNSEYIDNLAHGWTLLAPRGWGMSLWMAFNFAGARAQGLQERLHIGLEAGLPMFPTDWPGTRAYDEWTGPRAADEYLRWLRQPPGKRTNYLKFGVSSPFFPPFHKLLGIHDIPDVYPHIEPNDLECKMKRLRKINADKKISYTGASKTFNSSENKDATCDITMASPSAEPVSLSCSASGFSSFFPAAIWLVSGEHLTSIIRTLWAAKPDDALCDMDFETAFIQWANPLLTVVAASAADGSTKQLYDSNKLYLLERCLVRVRLLCSSRGVPDRNAPILNHSILESNSNGAKSRVMGYIMTGSFSLARGCGMAIGACSLRGLFELWCALSSSASFSQTNAKQGSPKVLIGSTNGGPNVNALLSIIC
ncbi:Ribonucleases P/MRP protein subunit pop1 [Coemansia sp. RSA 1358]|uniref:Ribonucleases P/MRP protein subunit pop1 n=1 Tax=Coemansia umbellata TaxID=1424467 RepID=A0ABQ8PFQ8_9FUNG|nr:Ribonucleases P/MRP protein subunit pop1 [Coemansia umbellata]KAJ2619788.1 Ribonucleases P/MRP protein subunit pop1 [Coemansia sp. RSA 1358]